MMNRYKHCYQWGLLFACVAFLGACDSLKLPELPKFESRAPLPVTHAPERIPVEDIPPDGVITLRPGDTIYILANRYRVTPRKIILANQLPPPYDLGHLTTLNLPKPRNHKVKSGDSVDSIAARYGVDRYALIRLNGLSEPYQLSTGSNLAIPRKLDYSALETPSPAANTTTASGSATASGSTTTTTTATASSAPRPRDGLGFVWPAQGTLVARFGLVSSGVQNDGINIAGTAGEAVRAAYDGEIAFVGSGLKSFGNMVLIKHKNGWISAYAHLGEISVKEGDRIRKGAPIGTMGQSGKVQNPQLHFQLRKSRTPVDPVPYLS